MCPERAKLPATVRHQPVANPALLCANHSPRGFSLPLALFILVVLGLLAAVLYRTIAIGNLSVAQEALSARAFLAADSGAQAGMMRVFPINGAVSVCTGGAGINQTLTGTGFNNCTVNLVCSSQTVNSDIHYTLTSTAICTAGNLRASRVVQVGAHNLVN